MVLVQQVLLEDLEGSNVHTSEGDDAQLHTHTDSQMQCQLGPFNPFEFP